MAHLFRAPVKVKDSKTGKRVPKLDAAGNPVLYPKWSAVIVDYKGRRKTHTFTADRRASQRMADLVELREAEIRLGMRPAPERPEKAEKKAPRAYKDTAEEYLAWGNAQGGRGGRPWSRGNSRTRAYYMRWWGGALGLAGLGDMEGKLGRAEAALRRLAAKGRAGKTLNLYREALFAFCNWCVDREYLAANPFRRMGRFDSTCRDPRRPLPPEDIRTLLSVVKPHRRLLYETAFSTGFRAGELRSLEPGSIDRAGGGIRLSADADKGRRERLQPVPDELLGRLEEYGGTGEALRLYRERFRVPGRPVPAGVPANPLLYVPSHAHRAMKADLAAAGIPFRTGEGKVDFHACRTAYINLVVDSGVDLKTAQTLARHSTPQLTMNVYAKAKRERLTAAVEAVGRAISRTADVPGGPNPAPEKTGN